jgi:hypothetical protein
LKENSMTTHQLITTDETADLADLEELQSYRDGFNQPTQDPMRAGQPVHTTYEYNGDEPRYFLQVTHRGMLLWFCPSCLQVTVGEPTGCGRCGTDGDLGPVLYEEQAGCRSWSANYGGQYEGPCLIAGSDGCECPEADHA